MSETDMKSPVEEAANVLIDKTLSIAFAESATAGRAAAEFSIACKAGKFLKGGLVCYDAGLKTTVLKVSQKMLDKYTPESREVTLAIAQGLSTLIEADLHIGITGLPCEGGSETPEKPVGTMFISAILHGEKLFEERKVFTGTHREIVDQTVVFIAELLLKYL
jgi:nicotinamide-nucleotide amidase